MPLERAWSLAWFDGIAEIQEPDKTLKGSNIQRLCSRLNRREYSIMALPNYVGSIKVDMTSTLDMLEKFEINLDWSAVGFTIKAIVMLNNLLRGVYRTKMSFIIMENPCFYIRRRCQDKANMTKLAACKFQGILSAAEAVIVIHATTDVLREMTVTWEELETVNITISGRSFDKIALLQPSVYVSISLRLSLRLVIW